MRLSAVSADLDAADPQSGVECDHAPGYQAHVVVIEADAAKPGASAPAVVATVCDTFRGIGPRSPSIGGTVLPGRLAVGLGR